MLGLPPLEKRTFAEHSGPVKRGPLFISASANTHDVVWDFTAILTTIANARFWQERPFTR